VPPALGDFRVVREIGRGAMGVVYEAEQVSFKRRVALKVLRFGGAADAEAMERFRREAETVARLHHTNIVPIFAVGCENGVHFFAMQLIAGYSLSAELAGAKAAGRPLDAKAVAGWGVQAAEVLAHAHARGVVHRDVKPSNLLLDGEGVVWLTDFGLARRSDEATLTVAGVLLGTPLYMSPEQASALDKPVDQRSDVYSLGATLYELATGRPVFEAPTAKQLLEQIATAEPIPPRRHRPRPELQGFGGGAAQGVQGRRSGHIGSVPAHVSTRSAQCEETRKRRRLFANCCRVGRSIVDYPNRPVRPSVVRFVSAPLTARQPYVLGRVGYPLAQRAQERRGGRRAATVGGVLPPPGGTSPAAPGPVPARPGR
jgi:serine/threonine protein kinase